jgi:hypothetical protein
MQAHATAPFWMEFRGVGSRVSGRVGGRVREGVRDAAALPAAEAQGGEVERDRDGRVRNLRQGSSARLRDARQASGCGRGHEVADLEALRRGLARLRATASVQCAFEDAQFAFSVTDRLAYPGSRAAVLGSADGCPPASRELGALR